MIDSKSKQVRMSAFRSNDLEQCSSPLQTLGRFSHFRQVSVSTFPKDKKRRCQRGRSNLVYKQTGFKDYGAGTHHKDVITQLNLSEPRVLTQHPFFCLFLGETRPCGEGSSAPVCMELEVTQVVPICNCAFDVVLSIPPDVTSVSRFWLEGKDARPNE